MTQWHGVVFMFGLIHNRTHRPPPWIPLQGVPPPSRRGPRLGGITRDPLPPASVPRPLPQSRGAEQEGGSKQPYTCRFPYPKAKEHGEGGLCGERYSPALRRRNPVTSALRCPKSQPMRLGAIGFGKEGEGGGVGSGPRLLPPRASNERTAVG